MKQTIKFCVFLAQFQNLVFKISLLELYISQLRSHFISLKPNLCKLGSNFDKKHEKCSSYFHWPYWRLKNVVIYYWFVWRIQSPIERKTPAFGSFLSIFLSISKQNTKLSWMCVDHEIIIPNGRPRDCAHNHNHFASSFAKYMKKN
jgi:hypothetical protein